METQNDLRMDATSLLFDANAAVTGILKNSKLKMHYTKLAVMSNIILAFCILYKVEDKYKEAQKDLQDTLVRVQTRKDRIWFNQDKQILINAHTRYCELMEAVSNEDLFELMQYVEATMYSSDVVIERRD